MAVRVSSVKPLALGISVTVSRNGCERRRFLVPNLKRTSSFCVVSSRDFSVRNQMATSEQGKKRDGKVIDSHLHVWASPEEVNLSDVQKEFLFNAKFFSIYSSKSMV